MNNIYFAVLCMCVLSTIGGFTIGVQYVYSHSKSLEPYEHCLQDNCCMKDVQFYIEYYDIKNRQTE